MKRRVGLIEAERELEALERKMMRDKRLPLRANLVFGEGNASAEVLFVGEAPGREEDKLIRPFVGRSGKLLDKLLADISWKRGDVYITNIVKRRPPENRDPSPREIAAYKPYLLKQIEILNPKLIVTLGRFSINYFLPEAKIGKDQGKLFCVEGRNIYPLFHPAAALRSPEKIGGALEKSFKRIPAMIKRVDKRK